MSNMPTSFRISDLARWGIERLQNDMGLKASAIVELLVREELKRRKIAVPTAEQLEQWRQEQKRK